MLLGVTGSGKTFTMANVIAKVNRPTLVISHNKTLAGQLYQEYRDFFPENAVSYFVSYYDYYQPEAYIPRTDTYIEKETAVNDLIDKLRLQATTNLMTRKDVIVVASVSCIYNLGEPAEYEKNLVKLEPGKVIERRELGKQLLNLQYERKETEFVRGSFRIRGDVIDIWPAYEDRAVRVRLEGEAVAKMEWIEPMSGEKAEGQRPKDEGLNSYVVYPAKHYITDPSKYKSVFEEIRRDLGNRVRELRVGGRLIEAHRLEQKTIYDLEMIQEVGYVNGIENYSRYFDGRSPGEPPHTLLDYFKKCNPDFLTIIDESHMSVPQIKGMYHGDQSRKQVLIDYGFRLPAAIDNRPLKLEEFLENTNQIIYTSATQDEWEIRQSVNSKQRTVNSHNSSVHDSLFTIYGVVEQLIRPTGLVDPEIEVRPVEKQIPDLVIEILKRKKLRQRVLVTTLTKRTAEDLTEYLNDRKKIEIILNRYITEKDTRSRSLLSNPAQLPVVSYLHADIHTLDRQDVLDKLRGGEVDVLVGINLLREGLDLPEVSLVAILDADQEGFLRSKTSLIQTMGRAARHAEGKVILYAHQITRSMKEAMGEVNRRRQVQIAYNLKHNIMPKTIIKPIRKKLVEREEKSTLIKRYGVDSFEKLDIESLTGPDRKILIRHLRKQMLAAADKLDFEAAAILRDRINELMN